jgi:hypothetical protein
MKHIILALALIIGLFPAAAWSISVSISDNVVVLDTRQRSGEIQLLSMTPSPVEFDITPMDVPEGVLDGRDYLRWSPPRTLVPANRGSPLRMVFRPPADLAPGEYVVRLAVKGRQVDFQPSFLREPEEGVEGDQGLAVGVSIQPVLPVTVYIRHQVESPALTVGQFEPVVDDERSHGYFMVSKDPDAISFVGTVALIGAESGNTLTSGRLRMGQTVDDMRIRVPRRDEEAELAEAVCLHIWPSFPARGQPEQRVCIE